MSSHTAVCLQMSGGHGIAVFVPRQRVSPCLGCFALAVHSIHCVSDNVVDENGLPI